MSNHGCNDWVKKLCDTVGNIDDSSPRMIAEHIADTYNNKIDSINLSNNRFGETARLITGRGNESVRDTLLTFAENTERTHGRAFVKALFSSKFLSNANPENGLVGSNYITDLGGLDLKKMFEDLTQSHEKNSSPDASEIAKLFDKVKTNVREERARVPNMARNGIVFKSVNHFIAGARHILTPSSKGFDGATPNYLSKVMGMAGVAAVADGTRRFLFGQTDREDTGKRETPYALAFGEIVGGSVAFLGAVAFHGRNATNLGSHYTRKVAEALKDTAHTPSR